MCRAGRVKKKHFNLIRQLRGQIAKEQHGELRKKITFLFNSRSLQLKKLKMIGNIIRKNELKLHQKKILTKKKNENCQRK